MAWSCLTLRQARSVTCNLMVMCLAEVQAVVLFLKEREKEEILGGNLQSLSFLLHSALSTVLYYNAVFMKNASEPINNLPMLHGGKLQGWNSNSSLPQNRSSFYYTMYNVPTYSYSSRQSP